ncbi:MAG: hypothetical protein IJR97_11975 [Clostridia bacterium]|nr:hypothetical protein [Clostridia bacterium]
MDQKSFKVTCLNTFQSEIKSNKKRRPGTAGAMKTPGPGRGWGWAGAPSNEAAPAHAIAEPGLMENEDTALVKKSDTVYQ